MKIEGVEVNVRMQTFELRMEGGSPLVVPFALADPAPTRGDPVLKAFVDADLHEQGVTYVLASGAWGQLTPEWLRHLAKAPGHVRDMLLYSLTLEARRCVEESGMGVRQISRRLETSPAQVYRLLDPTRFAKTIDQVVRLIAAVGYDAAVTVRPHRSSHRRTSASSP